MRKFSTVTGQNKNSCLHLRRVLCLNDKLDTYSFIFLIPVSFTKGFLHSVQSKEFICQGQKWIVRLEYNTQHLNSNKTEDVHIVNYCKQPLGFTIQWSSAKPNVNCTVDQIKFIIPHQTNYCDNLTHSMHNVTFTSNKPMIKNLQWIKPALLTNSSFLYDDSSGLLEVELSKPLTTFEEQLQIPRASLLTCMLESNTFHYFGGQWKVVLDLTNPDKRPRFCVQHLNAFNHWMRLKYCLSFCWHDGGKTEIDQIDQLISPESKATTNDVIVDELNWIMNGTNRQFVTVKLTFYLILHISRVKLIPTDPQGGKNCSRVLDPYGFTWHLVSDILGSLVRLKLYPTNESKSNNEHFSELDIQSGIKSSAWSVQLIPCDPTLNIIKSLKPFYVIYNSMLQNTIENQNSQHSVGAFQDVVLSLDVEKVCSSKFGYSRSSDNSITLSIEWIYCYMLNSLEYQHYDDLAAFQRHQLIKDLELKSAEIQRLKQLTKNLKHENQALFSQNKLNKFGTNFESHNFVNERPNSSNMLNQPFCKSSATDSDTVKSMNYYSRPSSRASVHTPSVYINEELEFNENIVEKKNYSFDCVKPTTVHNQMSIEYKFGRTLNPEEWANLSPATYRRHSSCLEKVGTAQQKQRRQLPSPPVVLSNTLPTETTNWN